jgi:MinD-like ATPase involved in chromosome partitioning or flagellar assembly
MYRLIQECKALADVVIFDSPPLLYSDALVLAPQVDGVLLAVNRGTTGRVNTVIAVECLRLVGDDLIGTVLNRVKSGPAYSYYPAHAKQAALALTAAPAVPALQAPSVVQGERTRIERTLADKKGDASSASGTGKKDGSPAEGNPARMTQQLDTVASQSTATDAFAKLNTDNGSGRDRS